MASEWEVFREGFLHRGNLFCQEVSGAWGDLDAILKDLSPAFTADRSSGPSHPLDSLTRLYGETAEHLLIEPLRRYRSTKPHSRVLQAIEDYDAQVDGLIQKLPVFESISSRDLELRVRGDAAAWWGAVFRLKQTPRPLMLRSLVSAHWIRRRYAMSPLLGALLLDMARATVLAVRPWQSAKRAGLVAALQRDRYDPAAEVDEDRREWETEVARVRSRLSQHLSLLRFHLDSELRLLARRVLYRGKPPSSRRLQQWTVRRQHYFAFWSRQQRATVAVLDLDQDLMFLGRDALGLAAEGMASLEGEHQDLMAELTTVAHWLEGWQSGRRDEPFPAPQARLLSAEDRTGLWDRELAVCARRRLPHSREVVEPKRALPGRRNPWRVLKPQELFLAAVSSSGRQPLAQQLEEAEVLHRAMVREIERAREVVTFSLEMAEQDRRAATVDHTAIDRITAEGIANALGLLRYQRDNAASPSPIAEPAFARATAGVFLEAHIAVEQGRLGLLAHLARQRSRTVLGQAAGLLALVVRRLARAAWTAIDQIYHWALRRIGWLAEPPSAKVPVVRTPYLDEVLAVAGPTRDLPMLYDRLFRLAPVEDPRFLVGREVEMSAISDARALWASGKGSSIIVLGARGSGKTSLLNCAVLEILAGDEVVRGHFHDRLPTPQAIEEFLRGLLHLQPPEDLEEALHRSRRVVIIEELERCYVRQIGGFQGLRWLLELMQRTAPTTLWIFGMNQHAYTLLDRALEVSRYFTFHINAVSVDIEQLRKAILIRHNLSGMRLQFQPPPQSDPRIGKARQWLGLEGEPQDLFFEALYRQSEGIFRAAFQLWQQYIDRVEGGMLSMRHPQEPDFDALIAELSDLDGYTLHAILQHGSLTPKELAEILEIPQATAASLLERLRMREILQAEPAGPGLRVRPEAGRLVSEILHRRNLV